jgi:hypothetical protein
MRTKTIVLSALLGALGSVSVMAQTNVYSLNVVGYINASMPPGYSQLTCPLISSPDNTIGTVLNNASGAYIGVIVQFYNPSTGGYSTDQGEAVGGRGGTLNTNGWANNGTNVLAPGVACWVQNPSNVTLNATFVGTVPTGALTNSLVKGYNLVGSIVPVSGDIITNSLSTLTNYNFGDVVLVYNPATLGYNTYEVANGGRGAGGYGYYEGGPSDPNPPAGDWNAPGDPIITNVYQGFWYDNSGSTVNWVENYSVN